MSDFPILTMITFLPLLGAGIILAFNRGTAEETAAPARYMALWTSLITFLLSLFLWFDFDRGTAEFQFVEQADWLPTFNITYHMGVDGISVLFVLLSTLLTPLCVICSWSAVQTRVKEYMIAFLVLETLMIGMFCALDFVLFYMFYEAVLIPMFLIIGIWGGPRRVYSAFKFFLYTLTGSVLLLLALLAMYFDAGTTDIPTLLAHHFPRDMQIWLWLALFASFAVKVPMWPVHTWLPDAHVEAPTAGSVILAAVLLKMGGYGFFRFSLPMLPEASEFFTPFIYTLSLVAIVYTSLVALAQEDMKKLIAYSSVAHMGFVTLGAFTGNQQGLEGALFQMLSHGVISAALFLIVGVIYDRIHTREIANYEGLVERMPAYSLVFMIFMLASVGLPGTGGFVGEFLILVGVFQANTWVALVAASGMVLGAAYMLYLYRRVIFGVLTKDSLTSILDMNRREAVVFAPLVVLVFWMGIYPMSFLDVMSVSVSNLIENYQAALAAAEATSVANLANLGLAK
jgi:NADH-quinone oxidoreductase subunit M